MFMGIKTMKGWMKKHEETYPFFSNVDSAIYTIFKALGTILIGRNLHRYPVKYGKCSEHGKTDFRKIVDPVS